MYKYKVVFRNKQEGGVKYATEYFQAKSKDELVKYFLTLPDVYGDIYRKERFCDGVLSTKRCSVEIENYKEPTFIKINI